jgi:hypothetical protein
MAVDLIGQLIAFRDMAACMAGEFSIHTPRSLIIKRMVVPDGETVPVIEYQEINPKPVILTADPKTASAFNSPQNVISIEIDDLQVKGISRKYSEADLVGTGVEYFIDGQLDSTGAILTGGVRCDFIAITRTAALTWDMLLRRKPDQRETLRLV